MKKVRAYDNTNEKISISLLIFKNLTEDDFLHFIKFYESAG